ncbi:MAG: hypothetical protein D3911_14305 [Candidatus Electrothrix sp. AW3_4]|nr:hypothetical protein [Candidatus Electrothrix gigas]
MKKTLIIFTAIVLQALSGNALARTEYCHDVLGKYKNAIKTEIQTYKDRGMEPSFQLKRTQSYLSKITPDVKITFVHSGNNGWVKLKVFMVSEYNDFRVDCIKSVLNKVCPDNWQLNGSDVQCKGW